MILVIILVAIMIFFVDIKPLLTNSKMRREGIIITAIAVFSISVAAMLSFGMKLPSPLMGMESIFRDVFKLAYPK